MIDVVSAMNSSIARKLEEYRAPTRFCFCFILLLGYWNFITRFLFKASTIST